MKPEDGLGQWPADEPVFAHSMLRPRGFPIRKELLPPDARRRDRVLPQLREAKKELNAII